MSKCDICDYEGDDVVAGRWIFYCPKHRQNDLDKTYENELKGDIENGDFSYISNDPELADALLEIV